MGYFFPASSHASYFFIRYQMLHAHLNLLITSVVPALMFLMMIIQGALSNKHQETLVGGNRFTTYKSWKWHIRGHTARSRVERDITWAWGSAFIGFEHGGPGLAVLTLFW